MGLLYIRECGDPYATDPPLLCPRGGTPYDLNSSPPILNYLPKTFTMEKVFLPDCKCGQPVAYNFELIPIYEDGIQVAQEQGPMYLYPMCEDCIYEAYKLDQEFSSERDELPF